MKNKILLIFSLFFALFVNAQVSKTVNVTTAGTLRTMFTITEIITVTNLTVTGSIDARDFKFMRDGITNLAVLDIGEVTIQAYNGTGGTSTSTLYLVNEMPQGSFNNLSKLKSVISPNSVTSIGNKAFQDCTGLTSINIPNTVTSIGNYVFERCGQLTNITIPNSVKAIGVGTFNQCHELTSLTIGNSVELIGNNAFQACYKLTSITIPNSVTTIGSAAFWGCSGLTSITIPNSVTSIGSAAFDACSGLTRITIPNSVTTIGSAAFRYCSGLTSIYVYATTPIILSSEVFNYVNVYACTLYVPAGSISAYQVADQWGDFHIVEMAPTALPTLALESVNIFPNPMTDGFYVNGLEGAGTLVITDLRGNALFSKQVKANDYVSVGYFPKGVYIVKIDTDKGIIDRKVIKE